MRALAEETTRTADFLSSLSEADWARPTRCAPWSVFELAVHAWRGSMRIREMIAAGPVESEAEKDAVTYCRFDSSAMAPAIAQRASEDAALHDPAVFASTWRDDWKAALDLAGDPSLIYPGVFGLMAMGEYLKTRVLEVTIHTMDLRDALGLAPDPTLHGLTVTCDVLRGLLGTDLRALGVDDVRFALTATGREPLNDSEKELLGPLADLMPVLR